ncbi:hypothetical protein [Methylobacterium radiodurans]|uniref:Uncharacterized protein n=1 Tax=Methylobacterium radiodurans TaxID=2202828 RepID=A0A2U8VVY7_9HYPH|nr:hypothetical protein [Methylobacterium radiodurans]AWN37927.1 hypothetical protein DK427_21135 [Methylobacterium radiodurans]
MTVDEFLASPDLAHGPRIPIKKVLLKELANLSSLTLGLDADDGLGALLRRDDLGATSVGDGAALP